jgi:hypothetical protein
LSQVLDAGQKHVTATEVTGFVVGRRPGLPRGSAKLTVTVLRSLLGFLHVSGVLTVPLAEVVPSVASWWLARLPQPLDDAQVAACWPTATGAPPPAAVTCRC